MENTQTARVKEKRKINEDDKKSEPWFDSECKKKKDDITKLGKKIQKSPKDQGLRTLLSNEKKSFRRIVLLKKRQHRGKMMALLESKRDCGTQKEFWDIFRKISPKIRKNPVQPSMEKFFDHFQNLSKSSRTQTVPPISTKNGPLDYEIELDELEYASKKIRLRKACGYD